MQTVLTDASTAVYSSVPVSIELLSSTKDSIRVKWSLEDSPLKSNLEGLKLKYIAEGSHVVEHTPTIMPQATDYDITHLHENTQYSICLEMYANLNKPFLDQKCLTANTSTDSLTVALGSTFGAFLALGIIILFVFIAKWQHTQRIRKRMSVAEQMRAEYDCEEYGADVEEEEQETSGLSMQVNEDTIKFSEIDSTGSRTSLPESEDNTTANGIVITASLTNCSECSDPHSSNHPMTNSTECCSCAHDYCLGNCTVVEYDPANPQIKRYKRGYLLRQKSIESEQSKLGYQYSLDSYDSSCRGSLPRQHSQDSSRCSSCSHTQLLIKQKSQDSAYHYRKYLAPTVDGTYDDNFYGIQTSQQGNQNYRQSPDLSGKPYSSHGTLNKNQSSIAGHQDKCQYDNNNGNLADNNENRPPDVRPKDITAYKSCNRVPNNITAPVSDPLNAQPNSQSTYLTSSERGQTSKVRNGPLIGTLRANNSCPSW